MHPIDTTERLIMALPWIILIFAYFIGIAVYLWIKDRKNPQEPVKAVDPVMPHDITTITGLKIAGVALTIFLFVQVVIQ